MNRKAEMQKIVETMLRAGKARIAYGANEFDADVASLTVDQVKLFYADMLGISVYAQPFLNGMEVSDEHILNAGDRLEFLIPAGVHG